MQFTRSSRLLAAQLEDHTVEIYDTSTGRIQTTLRGNNAPRPGIDFSADERFLVSTSRDLTVRVWDITTGVQS
ncbi:WD40 repeat domain-containing protein, partial [Salmonella sp. SAL4457]|uniref:WD40 repeat domain-containing protein n=1 Tax=Salmonella sp. SAL4457 TaxID=3159912 RepID=UPI00397A2197